ncbi:MAG: hypothetical protein AAB664_02970, partial [Patescibacteria group bacterium]
SQAPYSLTAQIPSSIASGQNILKAVAYDDIDNSSSETVSLIISSDASETIELIDPKNGQSIEKTTDVYTLVSSLKNPQNYSNVTVFAEKLGTGIKSIVGQTINPSSPFITIDWPLTETGTWVLSVTAKTKDGSKTILTAGSLVSVKTPSTLFVPAKETQNGTSTQATIFSPQNSLDPFKQP